MGTLVKVNINCKVTVKLSNYGLEHLKCLFKSELDTYPQNLKEQVKEYSNNKIRDITTNNMMYTAPLHVIMNQFGPISTVGSNPWFASDMVFDV